MCHNYLSVFLKGKDMPVLRRNWALSLWLSLDVLGSFPPSMLGQVILTHSSGEIPPHLQTITEAGEVILTVHLLTLFMALSTSGQDIFLEGKWGSSTQKNDIAIIYFLIILKSHISDMARWKIEMFHQHLFRTYCVPDIVVSLLAGG